MCIDHTLNGQVVLTRRTHEAVRWGGGRRCREVRHPGQRKGHSEPQKRPGTQKAMADWRGSSASTWASMSGAIDFATWEKAGFFLRGFEKRKPFCYTGIKEQENQAVPRNLSSKSPKSSFKTLSCNLEIPSLRTKKVNENLPCLRHTRFFKLKMKFPVQFCIR